MQIKEDIRIFQDAKNNKTTIVIWNMSEATKLKLAQLLLGDLKSVEQIEGITSTEPDMSAEVQSVDNMTQIFEPGLPASQIIMKLCSDYANTKDKNILIQIRANITGVYDEDEQQIKAVLFALKDMSSSTLDLLVEQMGFGISKDNPNRDQMIAQALAICPKETLITVLHKIVD